MEKAINTTSQAIVAGADGAAPEWLHMLPAGTFTGADGRGPYQAGDLAALVALFNRDGRKLPVDENHSIDLEGSTGKPSPARGWIVELQVRTDGIWGRVEWTADGEALVKGKSYGFLSPVFLHSKSKPYRVMKLLRVALTNDPNLTLKSLHSKQESVMLEELRKALGLPETADEAAVLAAVTAAHAANTAHTALMARVAEVAGVPATAEADALVTALQAKATPAATDIENASLKDQLKSLQAQLTSVVTDTAKDKAVAAIDGAIQAGKIVPALRDHYIARHMKAPAEVETELKVMPSLNAGGLGNRKQPEDGGPAVTAEDEKIIAMMGIDPKAYADTAKALHGKDQ